MIEIEFSALARLCLNRRIPTQAKLEAEVLALVTERDRKRTTIDWQFSIQTARTKLNSHYQRTHPADEKFKKLSLRCTKSPFEYSPPTPGALHVKRAMHLWVHRNFQMDSTAANQKNREGYEHADL